MPTQQTVGQESIEQYMKESGILETQTSQRYYINGGTNLYEVKFSMVARRTESSRGLDSVGGVLDELGIDSGDGIARKVSVILQDSKGVTPEHINANISLLLERYTANLIAMKYGYKARGDNGVLYLDAEVTTHEDVDRLIKAVRRYDRKINRLRKAGEAILEVLHSHLGVLDLKEEEE